MEDNTINYEEMTKNKLKSLCKERGIKGYSSIGITKLKIIQLLKGEITYNKNNLFDYLIKNNPLIIKRFVDNINNLKTISYGTMIKYKWKCVNYSKCSNIFLARPRDVYRNDSKGTIKYCNICKYKERVIVYQKNILEKNGSILIKIPNIINVWCEDNIIKPSELTNKSHKRVMLRCPNKSAKHPDYEIAVYNIQESNCYRCPKCTIGTSKAEMIIYSELKCIFKDVKWQLKIEDREADITIEDIKLVIEVDGYPWHMNKTDRDLEKNSIFEKNGYTVLRIRDKKLGEILCNNIVCDISELSLADYNKIVEWINNKFKSTININNEWKNIEYYKELQVGLLSIPYEQSIEYLFPESKTMWDYEKNHPFIPSQLSKGSHLDVWVKCDKGHSWKRNLKNLFRTIKGKKHIMKCPECFKPRLNKRILTINSISYRSIIEYCRHKNINKHVLYNKLKQNNIDITVTANIEKFIEEHLED